MTKNGNPTNAIIDRLGEIGLRRKDRPEHENLRRASVLVPLFLSDDKKNESNLHVLMTQRPMNMRLHGGEVCFPGGKQDPEDQDDDVTTALREAQEEIGLDPAHVQVICRLESLESYTGLCVTPIVGLIRPPERAELSNLTISKDEVEDVFSVPLHYFSNDDNLSSRELVPWRGGTFDLRTYHYTTKNAENKMFKIWGLTAYIAHQVAAIAVSS